MSSIPCPKCGTPVRPTAKYCGKCGEPVPVAGAKPVGNPVPAASPKPVVNPVPVVKELTPPAAAPKKQISCPNCNNIVNSDAKFCANCGKSIKGPTGGGNPTWKRRFFTCLLVVLALVALVSVAIVANLFLNFIPFHVLPFITTVTPTSTEAHSGLNPTAIVLPSAVPSLSSTPMPPVETTIPTKTVNPPTSTSTEAPSATISPSATADMSKTIEPVAIPSVPVGDNVVLSEDFSKPLTENWKVWGVPIPEITGMTDRIFSLRSVDDNSLQGITSLQLRNSQFPKVTIVQFDAKLSEGYTLHFVWHRTNEDAPFEKSKIIHLIVATDKINIIAFGKDQVEMQSKIPMDNSLLLHNYQIRVEKDTISLFIDSALKLELPISLADYTGYLSFYGSGDIDNVKFLLRDK